MRTLWVLCAFALAPSASAQAFDKPFWDRVFDGKAVLPDIRSGVQAVPAGAAAPRGLDSRVAAVLRAEESNRRDPVWPGYSILGQPLLVYAAETRSTLVNHPNPPPGYAFQQAAPYAVAAKDGPIDDLKFSFQYHRQVNGVDTFAYRYEPGGSESSDLELIVHERFHVFQETEFKKEHAPENEVDPDGRMLAMAALEQRALKAALNARDPAEASRFARQFTAIRAARYRDDPALEPGEADQERREGSAEYISRRLLARPGVLEAPEDAVRRLSQRLDMFPEVDHMAKTRYYGTGGAQGFLLDLARRAGWKERVAGGASMYSEMRECYPADPSVLARAKAEHGFDALSLKGEAKAKAFRREKAQAISAYEDAPGLELAVPIQWGPDVNFGFSASGPHYTMKDGSRLEPKVETVDVRAPGFVLHFEDRSGVISPDVRFHIEPAAVLRLDGKSASLTPGRTEFSSLALTGSGFELSSSHPGTLTVSSRAVSVSWR